MAATDSLPSPHLRTNATTRTRSMGPALATRDRNRLDPPGLAEQLGLRF
jgi:hypothetical protein